MSFLDLLFLNFWMTGFSLVVLPTALWVLIDASTLKVRRGKLGGGVFDMGVVGWFFSCLLLWIVAFPAYLAKRGEYQGAKDQDKPTTTAIGDLQTLADLRDRGVLSPREFESKKAELLKRI